jgi:E3 ubiquitin-protein ligase RGLG
MFLFDTTLFAPVTTADRAVFSFYPNEAPCQGFEDVLARYKEIVPYIRLAGMWSPS